MTTESSLSPPAIAIDAVSKLLGETQAVDRLSLSIAKGEFVTVLGPSGSGKTTLLHLIAGFHHPDTGRILLGGRDLTGQPPYRRDIGLIFQNYALFPHMTVFQNVAYPLANRGVRPGEIAERVRACLTRVKMSAFLDRYPTQLSGGQQQRVALARSIVYDPPVILMDEPLGALDKHLRRHMQDQIKQIHRDSGAAIVYVTHDQEEAMSMSDRVAVMRDGRLIQCDAPETLYHQPVNSFIAEFLGEANILNIEVLPRGEGITHNGAKVSGAPDLSVAPGRYLALFRPEHVSLTPGEEQSGSLGSGIIEIRDFLGDQYRIMARVPGVDSLIVVKQPASQSLGALPLGSSVALHWDWTRSLLLRE
jgi:ABC-type Fe3+/spermidine/putrescine transport system ATPase subunit